MALTHPNISADGWFSESEVLWPGQKFCLKVKEVVHVEHSGLQDVLIFDSMTHGRVLVLDGVIQLTARDEFAYQEMITHCPMFTHPDPRSVLIVGGGDGGVLREVTRHAGVTRVVMCDIDRRVVELSREHLADLTATAFDDPRVELLHMDAAEYVKTHTGEFDVVIVDSTDPVGPAESLFTKEFYANMASGLTDNGVICTQGECMWLHLDLIRRVVKDTKTLMPAVRYAYASVPTYPSGQIGFIIASKNPGAAIGKPSRPVPSKLQAKLRYYSASMHEAAFHLPPFAATKIYGDDDGTPDTATPAAAVAAAAAAASVDTSTAGEGAGSR